MYYFIIFFVGDNETALNKTETSRKRKKKPAVRDDVECEVCGKVLKTKAILRRHMNIHTGDKPHECTVCKARFTRNENLRVHMRLHTGERPYQCGKCDFKSTDKTSLTKHLKVHEKSTNFNCSKCDYQAVTKGNIVSHIIGMHSKKEAFMCRFCSYGFCTDDELNEHVKSDHPEVKHACQVCGKRFTSKSFLQRHTLSHTGEKPHKCTVCDRAFTRAETLREHMKTHNGELPVLKCDLCDFECYQNQILRRHKMKEHAKEPSYYSCSVCSFKGDTENDVLSHIPEAHDVSDEAVVVPPYSSANHGHDREREECNLCGQTFTQYSNLKRHMLIHLGVSKWKCEECGESFTRNAGLQSHLIKVHNHEPPVEVYTCKKCGFKAESRQYLDIHTEEAHKNEYQYDCDICNEFSCNDKMEFVAHVSSAHQLAYAYFCKYCEKGFQKKTELFDHVKDEHGSSKVHECVECGEGFLRKSSYMRHLKTQHLKERPFKCDICSLAFDRREKLLRHAKTHQTNNTVSLKKESLSFDNMQCKVSLENICPENLDSVTPLTTHVYNSPTKKLLSSLKRDDRASLQDSKPGDYQCEICNKDFSSKRSLARHKAGHANKRAVSMDEEVTAKGSECQHRSYRTQNQVHHCVECGDTFSRRGAMNRHFRTVHLLIKAYKCDICHKAFTRQDTLKSHLQNHSDYNNKGHCCDICKMGFESEAGLRIHIKLLHKTSKSGAAPAGDGIDCEDKESALTLVADTAGSYGDEMVAIKLPPDTIHIDQSDDEVLIDDQVVGNVNDMKNKYEHIPNDCAITPDEEIRKYDADSFRKESSNVDGYITDKGHSVMTFDNKRIGSGEEISANEANIDNAKIANSEGSKGTKISFNSDSSIADSSTKKEPISNSERKAVADTIESLLLSVAEDQKIFL